MDGLDPHKERPTEVIKNTRGDLGDICAYCAGFGYTNNVTGSSSGCQRCLGTGVEPVDTHELNKKVDKLTEMVAQLLKEKEK